MKSISIKKTRTNFLKQLQSEQKMSECTRCRKM